MAERIGQGSCPVCASPKARYTLSKKQLVCVTCDGCNVQVFARSDRSDQLLRALIRPAEAEPAAVEVKNTLPPDPVEPASSSPGEPPAADPIPETPAPPAQPRRRSLMEW